MTRKYDNSIWGNQCRNIGKAAGGNAEPQPQDNTPLCADLLADKHTGMKISAAGILGRIRDGRYYKELNFGCGEMLRHLEEMANRFYAGDPKAVDEFLQLYDLDDNRPSAYILFNCPTCDEEYTLPEDTIVCPVCGDRLQGLDGD